MRLNGRSRRIIVYTIVIQAGDHDGSFCSYMVMIFMGNKLLKIIKKKIFIAVL